MASTSIATAWANMLRPLQACSLMTYKQSHGLYMYFHGHTIILTALLHSHGLSNNLKALVNPYPKKKVLLEAVKMLLEAVKMLLEAQRVLI